jgi:hypothetical protein
VTFKNYDDVDHVIVGAGSAWGSDGIMRQGDSFTARFGRDGVYPFQCYLHPGMSGAVLVGDANGLGAATSGGVIIDRAPDGSSPSVAAVPAVPSQPTSNEGFGWALGLGALALALAAAALGLRRSKVSETALVPPVRR